MVCTLMHKRMAVALLELDEVTGFIRKINTVYAPEHLPVGTMTGKGVLDRRELNEWWTDRSIPASRSGVREAMEILHMAAPRLLLLHCYGLSLSDHYWICPEYLDLSWDQVNFFENSFSEDMGDILFGTARQDAEFDLE